MTVLYGYHGERNAGDDAFTVILARCLPRLTGGPIGVLAKRVPHVPLPGVRTLYARREWRGFARRIEALRIGRWLSGGSALVVGGGSLFRTFAEMDALQDLLARTRPDAIRIAIGVSIGPFADSAAAALASRLVSRFSFVGVRDRASLAALQHPSEGNVALTFDLAPLLPVVCPELDGGVKGPRRGLGVALCGPATSEEELEQLADSIAAAHHQWGKEPVILLPFNADPVKGDLAAHRALAHALSNRDVDHRIDPYSGDPRVTFRTISGLRGLIGGRLHAAIFGYVSGTPVLVAPYQEKSRGWAEMIGLPASAVIPLQAIASAHIAALAADPSAFQPALPRMEARAQALSNLDPTRWTR